MLPFARQLGYRVPPFDFGVPGVTRWGVRGRTGGLRRVTPVVWSSAPLNSRSCTPPHAACPWTPTSLEWPTRAPRSCSTAPQCCGGTRRAATAAAAVAAAAGRQRRFRRCPPHPRLPGGRDGSPAQGPRACFALLPPLLRAPPPPPPRGSPRSTLASQTGRAGCISGVGAAGTLGSGTALPASLATLPPLLSRLPPTLRRPAAPLPRSPPSPCPGPAAPALQAAAAARSSPAPGRRWCTWGRRATCG